MDQLLVNLVLMGYGDHDLGKLNEYCQAVSEACGIPIPDNYPVIGRDAFRTATGVHAAAVIKAWRKGDRELMDAVYSAIPASLVGREQEIDIGPMSGKSNVVFWLEKRGITPTDVIVDRVFREGESVTDRPDRGGDLAAVYQTVSLTDLVLEKPLLDLRQRRQHDIPHNLQTLCADVLERVSRRVPGFVVEIDDVHGLNACLEEGQMVVFDRCRFVKKVTLMPEPAGGVQMMSVSQGVELASRRILRCRSPIMSSSTSALMLSSGWRHGRPARSGGSRKWNPWRSTRPPPPRRRGIATRS